MIYVLKNQFKRKKSPRINFKMSEILKNFMDFEDFLMLEKIIVKEKRTGGRIRILFKKSLFIKNISLRISEDIYNNISNMSF